MRHNRRVINENGQKVKIFNDLSQRIFDDIVKVKIGGENQNRKKRSAICKIKFGKYQIPIPVNIKNKSDYRSSVIMNAVQIKEVETSVPKSECALHWTLWTSQEIENIDQALAVIHSYRKRWEVEEAHRLLKTKGFNLESSELESAQSIRKWLLLGMAASIKIMQLKAARSGKSDLEIESIFNNKEQACLKMLNGKLEGNTEKQKNPFPEYKLPWASWIIARLGGWKGYQSQRPPGIITFKRGLSKFEDYYYMFNQFNNSS